MIASATSPEWYQTGASQKYKTYPPATAQLFLRKSFAPSMIPVRRPHGPHGGTRADLNPADQFALIDHDDGTRPMTMPRTAAIFTIANSAPSQSRGAKKERGKSTEVA